MSSSDRIGSTPYPSIARYTCSQHLDHDPQISKLISDNRHAFENFVVSLGKTCSDLGVANSPELDLAIQLITQAKDALGRALIHHVGKVRGVEFEAAVSAATSK